MKRMVALTALVAAMVVLAGRLPGQGVAAADPLPVTKDAVKAWVGDLEQKGTYKGKDATLTFKCELRITARPKEGEFEGELNEKETTANLEVTYKVTGTLTPIDANATDKGYIIKFKSTEAPVVKRIEKILNVEYDGKLEGGAMKGTWKPLDKLDNTTLNGTFNFTPKKD